MDKYTVSIKDILAQYTGRNDQRGQRDEDAVIVKVMPQSDDKARANTKKNKTLRCTYRFPNRDGALERILTRIDQQAVIPPAWPRITWHPELTAPALMTPAPTPCLKARPRDFPSAPSTDDMADVIVLIEPRLRDRK